MVQMQDILIKKDNNNLYDISFENGDFKLTDGLDTAIVLSFFTDGRADSSEVSEPILRRGWIGNEQNENEDDYFGSKLWLLDQARINDETSNRSTSFSQDALSWMLDSGYVTKLNIDSEIINKDKIRINIVFTTTNNKTESRQYDLWKNTDLEGL